MAILYYILGLIAVLLFIAVIKTACLKKKTTFFSLSEDEARTRDYSEKLSRMIQVETVSHRGNPEVEKFRGFHRTMEELFPTVFEKLEKIIQALISDGMSDIADIHITPLKHKLGVSDTGGYKVIVEGLPGLFTEDSSQIGRIHIEDCSDLA